MFRERREYATDSDFHSLQVAERSVSSATHKQDYMQRKYPS